MLLAVNAVLVAAIAVSGGVTRDKWLVYLAGAVFGVIWTLSIGRTCLFQDIWQIKLAEIRGRHLDDPRFAVLETAQTKEQARGMTGLLGRVPSKRYLLLSPLGFTVVWLWLFFLSL
jgi:hypothetical protein